MDVHLTDISEICTIVCSSVGDVYDMQQLKGTK